MSNWLAEVQLSVAITLRRTLGTIAWQEAFAGRVMEAGALWILGAVLSATAKGTFVVAVLPELSLTLTAIVCRPTSIKVPAEGVWLMTNWLAAVQLSLAETFERTSGTAAAQFGPAEEVIGP